MSKNEKQRTKGKNTKLKATNIDLTHGTWTTIGPFSSCFQNRSSSTTPKKSELFAHQQQKNQYFIQKSKNTKTLHLWALKKKTAFFLKNQNCTFFVKKAGFSEDQCSHLKELQNLDENCFFWHSKRSLI